MILDQFKAGITGETSAPVVVVPIDPLPTFETQYEKMSL
jgi:hypothetical protein